MIYITKNTTNQVVLELTSVSSLLSPYYLFHLTKTDSNNTPLVELLFTGTDLSTFKSRYNRFEVIETGSTYVNLTASTISVLPGSYNYDIYESSTQTLSISATTGVIISTGKMFVDGVETSLPSIYR